MAAVLDTLSDAKETTRQQVIGLVERLALQLEQAESKTQQLVRENQLLRNQLNMVGDGSRLTKTLTFYQVYKAKISIEIFARVGYRRFKATKRVCHETGKQFKFKFL